MKKDELERILCSYLHMEDYSLDQLAIWAKTHHSNQNDQRVSDFRSQLRQAIVNFGTVTPQMYEKWTDEELDSQEAVQQRLKEIWSACF